MAGAVGSALSAKCAAASASKLQAHGPIRAIIFDAFALFDSRSVLETAARVFPEKSAALVAAWKSRQFEYQWLHTLGNHYIDFWQATKDSLTYAARQVGVALTTEEENQLMAPYANLVACSDVADVLPEIARCGLKLGVLSNMTGPILESGLTRAGVRGLFSHVLSTDTARSCKPSRAAYRLGVSTLQLNRSEILFVAFAGWDVAGSVWFGFPTYWLNRLGSVTEELDAVPLGSGVDLKSLLGFIQNHRAPVV